MRQGTLECRTPTPRQLWAWVWIVVMVAVLGGGIPPAEASMDLPQLEASVQSNRHALIRMNYYLKQTDTFWKWYQKSHRRLDDLLANGVRTKSLESGGIGDPQLQDLYRRLDSMQSQYDLRVEEQAQEVGSLRESLAEQRRSNDRLHDDLRVVTTRLSTEETTSARLRHDLSRAQQALRQSEAAVASLEGKVGAGVSADVVMFVKNLAKQANRSLEDLHAQVTELRDQQVAQLAARVTTLDMTTQENLNATQRIPEVMKEVLRVGDVVRKEEEVLETLSETVDGLQQAHYNFTEDVNTFIQTVVFPMEDQIRHNNQTTQELLEALSERMALVQGQIRSLRRKTGPKGIQ